MDSNALPQQSAPSYIACRQYRDIFTFVIKKKWGNDSDYRNLQMFPIFIYSVVLLYEYIHIIHTPLYALQQFGVSFI